MIIGVLCIVFGIWRLSHDYLGYISQLSQFPSVCPDKQKVVITYDFSKYSFYFLNFAKNSWNSLSTSGVVPTNSSNRLYNSLVVFSISERVSLIFVTISESGTTSSSSKVSTYRGIFKLKSFSSISSMLATCAYLSTSLRF